MISIPAPAKACQFDPKGWLSDLQSDLFGMVKWPKGLSDLQLRDEKGTLNHLVTGYFTPRKFRLCMLM